MNKKIEKKTTDKDVKKIEVKKDVSLKKRKKLKKILLLVLLTLIPLLIIQLFQSQTKTVMLYLGPLLGLKALKDQENQLLTLHKLPPMLLEQKLLNKG